MSKRYCPACDASYEGEICGRCNKTELQGWAYIKSLENQANKSALDGQVAGKHYRDMVIQPCEYTTKNGIGHLAGDAIAYISRYRAKNGREDLEKAIHSIQLLIELEYGSG